MRAPCLYESSRGGGLTAVDVSEETVMAGLSCGEPSEVAWSLLSRKASDFITIPDSVIAPAMRLLADPSQADIRILARESAVPGISLLACVVE